VKGNDTRLVTGLGNTPAATFVTITSTTGAATNVPTATPIAAGMESAPIKKG